MPPSRFLLHLISLSVSPSFLLAAARESLASLEEEIAQLRLAGAEDAEVAESGGVPMVLSNYDPMLMKGRTDGEVKENIQGDLLENGDTRGTTTIQGGDNNGEQAPDLDQRISAISVVDFIKPTHKKLSEIDLVAPGANESSSEPRFLKDLREKKYTILELEEQEGVLRQDVRLSNTPHSAPRIPSPPLSQRLRKILVTRFNTSKNLRSAISYKPKVTETLILPTRATWEVPDADGGFEFMAGSV